MALPVNIDDLVNHRKVEWARIEYKEGWNPEKVLHTLCAFANDIDNWGGGYIILGIAENAGKPVFPVKGIRPDAIDKIQKELLGVCHLIEPLYLPVVEPERMEINSIPGPDRSIKKADLEKFRLFAKQDRNRRIGEFLKELELAEARNTGYPAILRAIERNGSPKPIIETNTSRDYFTFVLPVHKYFLQSNVETMRELNATDDPITVPVPYQYRTSTVPVTDPVKKLLAALRDGPCSPSDLRIAVGIKHRQTFRANYLNPALRNGLICAKDGLFPHDPNIRYSLTDVGRRLLQEVSSEADEVSHARNRVEREVSDETNAPQNEVVKGGINKALNVLSSCERTIKRTIKEELLEVISRTPGVAGPALIAATGKGRTVVMEALAALRRAGKIEHRGSKKTGGYFTTEE